MLRDFASHIAGDVAIPATAIASDTTTAQPVASDVQDARSITFEIVVHDYTDGTYTPAISESDASDMTGENPVGDSDLASSEADAALSAAGVSYITYIGDKRYITCDIVSTGVTTGATVSVQVIEERRIMPTN